MHEVDKKTEFALLSFRASSQFAFHTVSKTSFSPKSHQFLHRHNLSDSPHLLLDPVGAFFAQRGCCWAALNHPPPPLKPRERQTQTGNQTPASRVEM